MKNLKSYSDRSKCWWCGSNNLSGEHKMKKTELEMLYGKTYQKDNFINHIKYKTETKGKNIQSSNAKRVKFEKNLCKNCNGSRSQKFDKAYQQLIEYYYHNRIEIIESRILDLEVIFGDQWKTEYLNVERYIAKHLGCRLAELGLLPTKNLISFLDQSSENKNLKVSFQIKPYFTSGKFESIDSIFMGPANLINNSMSESPKLITSLSGWYTIANFTWNYLHEHKIAKSRKINKVIKIDLVDYSGLNEFPIQMKEESLMSDWSKILDKFEYYPYENGIKELEHYQYMKNVKLN